jgi:hypothetical protein
MTMPVYPLHQVLEVKKRRVEDAEKVVQEKRLALEKEKEKLVQCEASRDKVLNHKKAKLKQLRKEMESATTTDKIQQMKVYLKIVDDKLAIEEKKVKDQKDQVELAEKNLQMALHELKLKRQEVDKLNTHKETWLKEARKELEVQEERDMNELGTVTYLIRKRQGF